MYFAEIVVLPAILFSPKIKVATHKTAIYSTVRVHFRKFRWQSNGFCIRLVSIESMEIDVAVISRICGRIKPFCVMSTAVFWCAYTARGILEYLPITRSWFAAELSRCLDKMADVNSVDLIKNALLMPRLAICSRDLHWHWINWTLLCDTMEVSMLRLAWLTTAQHVFQPALTGRLELVSRKIVSRRPRTKAIAVSKFREKLSPANGSKELPWFREKYRVLGRQKMGSNMRPRYIRFRDIHDRDISGLHCIIICRYIVDVKELYQVVFCKVVEVLWLWNIFSKWYRCGCVLKLDVHWIFLISSVTISWMGSVKARSGCWFVQS